MITFQTRPGLTLESYVAWAFALQVENEEYYLNASCNITRQKFNHFVASFEPYREQVEKALAAYPNDANDFRAYVEAHMEEIFPPALYIESSIHLMAMTSPLSMFDLPAMDMHRAAAVIQQYADQMDGSFRYFIPESKA